MTVMRVSQTEAGTPLLEFLSGRLINESKVTLRRVVGTGEALVNGQAVPSGHRLRTGDSVAVPTRLDAGPPPEQQMPVEVLYEDGRHLCVNKPVGVPVVPARDGANAEYYESLVAFLNREAPRGGPYVRPHVVHRLDQETSGVLLVACDAQAARDLGLQFQHRHVHKSYLCVVEGVLPLQRTELEIPMERDPQSVLTMRPARKGGKPAQTLVTVEERFGHFCLVRAEPLSGRQHQIRVHLAATGYPLVVDRHYGRRERLTGAEFNAILGRRVAGPDDVVMSRLPLHAASIRYVAPGAVQEREQRCPVPADMASFVDILRRFDPPR